MSRVAGWSRLRLTKLRTGAGAETRFHSNNSKNRDKKRKKKNKRKINKISQTRHVPHSRFVIRDYRIIKSSIRDSQFTIANNLVNNLVTSAIVNRESYRREKLT